MRLPKEQSDYLDAWRGASAIAVLAGHSVQIFQADPWPIWGAFSTAAVMVFFVLSGFFIRKSLDSCLARNAPLHFAAARVNRIIPPFIFSIALTVALWAVAPVAFQSGSREFLTPHARPDFSLEYLPSTLLFLNGFLGGTLSSNGPLWSLSYEVWYYALALMFSLRGWRLPAMLLAALLTWRSPGFAILGTVWFLGFTLPPLPKWLVAMPLAALPFFLFDPELPTIALGWQVAVGVGFAAHLANLPDRPPNLLIQRSASFSYTLYVVHFPLLLFAYGSIGVNWFVPFAILIFAAVVGPPIERIKLIPSSKSQGALTAR